MSLYKHYAAQVSLFSGKSRAYLRYKGISFEEITPSANIINKVIYPNTGKRMIPVVETPEGEFIQDTTCIIDHFENLLPSPSIYPDSAVQKLAGLLLELFADEWLLLPAMHYRWHYKRQNLWFILKEFGATAAPNWPRMFQPFLALVPALYFGRLYKPVLGVSKRNFKLIEKTYLDFLDAFNKHLTSNDFVFGTAPSIADFGLIGPMYAHLYRDPFPGELMRAKAEHVVAWVERMQNLRPQEVNWDKHGQVSESLTPIFKLMVAQQFPVLQETVKRVAKRIAAKPNEKLPRFLGKTSFAIDNVDETRFVNTYAQWMLQRPINFYQKLNKEEKLDVDRWLHSIGAYEFMQTKIKKQVVFKNNKLFWDGAVS